MIFYSLAPLPPVPSHRFTGRLYLWCSGPLRILLLLLLLLLPVCPTPTGEEVEEVEEEVEVGQRRRKGRKERSIRATGPERPGIRPSEDST
jgi:hypothetical protein